MKSRGFTMVEVAIVLAILAILASVAIPKFTRGARAPRPTWVSYNVSRFHDDSLRVTCWVRDSGGIFCIPDKELGR